MITDLNLCSTVSTINLFDRVGHDNSIQSLELSVKGFGLVTAARRSPTSDIRLAGLKMARALAMPISADSLRLFSIAFRELVVR